jgi:hypothetical protein
MRRTICPPEGSATANRQQQANGGRDTKSSPHAFLLAIPLATKMNEKRFEQNIKRLFSRAPVNSISNSQFNEEAAAA